MPPPPKPSTPSWLAIGSGVAGAAGVLGAAFALKKRFF